MCLVTAQENFLEVYLRKTGQTILKINEEFDPGSERTLVACLIHASRAVRKDSGERVSNA